VAALNEVTGVVLAGGSGTRAGGPKAAVQLDGETLLARAVRLLAGWLPAVVVATRDGSDPIPAPAVAVVDAQPGAGPLVALPAALEACRTPWALVVGCDMPDLDRPTLERLISRADIDAPVDVVVPIDKEAQLQPLHAVYRVACAPTLRAAVRRGARSMQRALAGLRCDVVPQTALRDLPGAWASMAGLNTSADIAARQARGGTA